MIAIVTTIIGVLWGILRARRLKGNRLDMAQYGAVFGIIGLLVGLVATIVLARLA